MNQHDRTPLPGHERLDANWRAITAELDAPAPALIERVARRLGVPGHVTRLVHATPALRRSWFVAVLGVALLGIATANDADPRGSLLVLLVVAPLLPVLGVVLAFGPGADPAHEIQVAMPLRGARLVAIRALTVLVVAIGLVVPVSRLSDVARPMAAAWLLPALATTAASLAVMSIASPRRAAGGVSVVWVVGVLVVRVAADDPLAAFGVVGQLVASAVAIAATVVVVRRRNVFDLLAVRVGEVGA